MSLKFMIMYVVMCSQVVIRGLHLIWGITMADDVHMVIINAINVIKYKCRVIYNIVIFT